MNRIDFNNEELYMLTGKTSHQKLGSISTETEGTMANDT